MNWCDDTSKNTAFAIETATKSKAQLQAKIQELTSDIQAADSAIDGLASAIATAGSELKDAALVRGKESADFAASEKELVESIDAISRAISILDKEMAKNPAAFAQIDPKNMNGALQAFRAILDAAALSSSDQQKLTALVQSQQGDDADDDELGSPAAAAYKTHSGNILDVLEDLKEKAEGQLSDLRKAEGNTQHNFNLLKQSLEDQIAANTRHMNDEKADKAAAAGVKTSSQSDLDMTNKELANSQEQLATCQATCIKVAADHDATVAARTEELKVIAEARKVLADTTSGAVAQTYSFIQSGSSRGARLLSRADLAGREVIELVRNLARKEHSSALNQLASRISAVARYGGSNREDVFAKVKGLIQAMIAKLEKEASSEATEKAYCDEQIAKTEAKKGELEEDVAKMTSRIDQAAAKSAKLKGQVKELEDELAALARTQAEMDNIRSETHADYTVAKADLELGLTGVH